MVFHLIRYISIIVAAISIVEPSFGQIVLSGGAKIKLNGGTNASPVYVVLNAPPATPILSGATDGIIMESEYNRVQYNLGTGNTAITVPYMSNLLEKIPLTLTPTAAGTGAGNIRFAGFAAATRATGFDNNNYRPSDVTNMGALPGITNNSAKTIDRFWIIDANGYTTKPAVTLAFTYIDAEWALNGGNNITEINLRAQRFNTTMNEWGGYVEYLPSGTINTAANTVSNVIVSPANFFRSWTLNDNSIPLPIQLMNFNAECVNQETILKWCTASETNNDFFTLETSTDGVTFLPIATVNGNGTTQSTHCYEFNAGKGLDTGYVRLKQTDFNGSQVFHSPIYLESCGNNEDIIFLTNNGTKTVGIISNSSVDERYQLNIYNSLGQIIEQHDLHIEKGQTSKSIELKNVSNALYYLSLENNTGQVTTKKIVISDQQ